MVSCSKKNDPEPKQQEYFVKTIKLTFPLGGLFRESTFEYDERNRIKDFDFKIGSITYKTLFIYNDLGLITRANMDVSFAGPDRRYGNIFEFEYTEEILSAYKKNGTRYPVTYNAANNSYVISFQRYHWDVNNNLTKITHSTSGTSFLDINYLSGTGVFKEDHVQMAFAIFSDELARASDPRPIHHAMEHFAFSKNEIGNFSLPGSINYYLSCIRDGEGNIVSYEMKNHAGDLLRKYELTYEKRDML